MNPPTITIANRDELFIVNLHSVAYFKAEGHYTNVFYLNGTKLLVPSGLSKLHEKILSVGGMEDRFVPMGRSLLVNRREICSLNPIKETMLLCGTHGQMIQVHVPKSVLRAVMKDHFG